MNFPRNKDYIISLFMTTEAIGGGGINMQTHSFYNGSSIRKRSIDTRSKQSDRSNRSRRSVGLVFIFAIILIISSLTFAFGMTLIMSSESDETEQARTLGESKIPITLQFQHKDTVMPCIAVPIPCGAAAHVWNDAAGADGIYGNANDCPHCSAYCAPASISMIALAYGMPAVNTQQDDIYDNGKSTAPEVCPSGFLETHGVGMFDGSGGRAQEVQTSLLWALAPGGIGFI